MALQLGIGLGLIPTAARPAATTAPVNIDKPFFEGPLTQGQSAAANPGSWTGLPSPNFVYAIKRGATTVSTDPAYIWTAADVAAGVGAMTVAVTATNDIGPTTATSDPVTIAAALQLSGSPSTAAVGVPYSFTPTRTGGHPVFTFALDGTLPSGLTFSTATGAITGSAVASGTATLSIDVTDGDGLTASLGPFELVVSADALYEGLVATRARMGNLSHTAANRQAMSRSAHKATTNITSLKLLFANFIPGTALEVGQGGATPATVEASIEYPSGTFTRVTFPAPVQSAGDPNIGAIPAVPTAGATTEVGAIFSDYIPINIPLGAIFWVRQFFSSPTGIFYVNGVRDVTNSDLLAVGVTTTNRVMGGAIAHNASTGYLPPMAIVGPTDAASVLLVGDSIMAGQNAAAVVDSRIGIVGASLPVDLAFVNLAIGGTKASDLLTRAVARAQLFPYCSHMALNTGVNDSASAPAVIASNNTAIAAAFPERVTKYLCTITPRTTSTDSWATLVNQTIHGATTTPYQPYNDLVRAGSVSGFDGFFELTHGVLEAAPENSGKWVVDGAAQKYTNDGLHPTAAGYLYAAATGTIPASAWTYTP